MKISQKIIDEQMEVVTKTQHVGKKETRKCNRPCSTQEIYHLSSATHR